MGREVFDAVARASLFRVDGDQLRLTVDLVAHDQDADRGASSAVGPLDVDWRRGLPVQVERSPNRMRLAVLVGGTLFDVDLSSLRDGFGGGSAVVDPVPGGSAALVWDGDVPRVVSLESDRPRRLGLSDGRVLVVDAPITDDDGFSGGDYGSSSPFRLPSDMGSEEGDAIHAEIATELADRAAARRPARARIEGLHPSAILLDGPTLPANVQRSVHWPVSVGSSGVVVRASTTRTDADGAWSTTTDEPWFVAHDGTVTQIPERLGHAPLCELPDGRWLLFGADPLWGDAGNQPLHAIALDGAVTPFAPAGVPVTTTALLASVAPDLLPQEPPEDLDDWPWATAARVSHDGAHLTMLIAGIEWEPRWDPTEDIGWALVRLPFAGAGGPVLLARGRRTAESFESFAL